MLVDLYLLILMTNLGSQSKQSNQVICSQDRSLIDYLLAK
jgi:hypothetical protein